MIDAGTAAKEHFAVGDTVDVATAGERHTLPDHRHRHATATSTRSAARSIAVWDLTTAQTLLDREGRYDIDLDRREGRHARRPSSSRAVAAARARRRSRSRTARSRRRTTPTELNEGMKYIRYFLLGFGGIALFVGAFVIFNTLSITVAQRTREFATLRTLGASRKQVMRSVVLEGLVIGLRRLGARARARLRDRQGHDRACSAPWASTCRGRHGVRAAHDHRLAARSAPASRCSRASCPRGGRPACRRSRRSARARRCRTSRSRRTRARPASACSAPRSPRSRSACSRGVGGAASWRCCSASACSGCSSASRCSPRGSSSRSPASSAGRRAAPAASPASSPAPTRSATRAARPRPPPR